MNYKNLVATNSISKIMIFLIIFHLIRLELCLVLKTFVQNSLGLLDFFTTPWYTFAGSKYQTNTDKQIYLLRCRNAFDDFI